MASGFQRIKDILFLQKVLFIADAYRRMLISSTLKFCSQQCLLLRNLSLHFFCLSKRNEAKKKTPELRRFCSLYCKTTPCNLKVVQGFPLFYGCNSLR
jgi:hypothetical protein